MIRDPRTAPPRTDLPWLRRRAMRKADPPAGQQPAAGSATGALRDFLTGHATGEHHHDAQQPAAVSPPAPRTPTAAGAPSLDLDAPAAPRPAAPARPTPSLDLGGDAPAPTTAPASSVP